MTTRGLTGRGWSLLVAACAVAGAAVALGQDDLLRVAVLLVALPLVALVHVWWVSPRAQVRRTVPQPVTQVGRSQIVTLRVRNPGRWPSGPLLLAEELPRGLGHPPRVVVPPLPGGGTGQIRYEVTPGLRGRWELGPVCLQVADPFGLCRLGHSWQATDPILVRPRVLPLRPLGLVGALSDVGSSARLSAAGLGDPDLTLREYRAGDDRRRVHWKATARRGRLMVRQEELPHQPRGTVLLDAGVAGFGGGGPWLEWAVEAAASVAMRLAADGFSTRLVTDGRDDGWTAPTNPQLAGRILDRLALLQVCPPSDLPAAARLVARGGDGVLVAVLTGGRLPEHLLGLPRLGGAALAVVLDPARWGAGRPAAAPAQLEAEGWCVVPAGLQDPVEQVWSALVQRHRARARVAG